MNSSNFRFTLDLHSIQSQYSIPVLVGDTGVTLHISITDGGIPYIINDGCLAKLSIRRPTGTHLEEFCTIRNNAIIEYPFRQNENTCAVEGIHHCDVTLYGPNGEKVGGPRFTMVVSERVIRSDDIVVTDEDRTIVDAMMEKEASRQFAESTRVVAEAIRVTAEEQRVSAEAERIAAEEERLRIGQIAFESAERAKLSEANAKNSENTARDFADSALQSAGEANESAEISRQIASDMVNIKTRGERNDKRITNLEKGIPSELFETDSSVVHSKVAPTNTLPFAEVSKIGGMTYKEGNTLKSAKVTELNSIGKNMIDYTKAQATTTHNGITFINNGDGSFTVNGTATALATCYIHKIANGDILLLKESVNYTVSGALRGKVGVCVYDEKWKTYVALDKESSTFTIANGSLKYGFYLYINAGVTVNNAVVYPQLEIGSKATEHRAYKEVVDTFVIPAEVQALDGYGEGINETCYNYIDCEKKQFVKRVGKVDMGTLNWVLDDGNNMFRAEVSGLRGSILCTKYETVFSAFDEGIHASIGEVSIFPASVVDVSSLSGEMLYYELSTPEVTDISHLITADNFIEVESNGTITAVNENSFAVPSEITYMLKEVAV